ncbi:unnamed protein product [Diamesa tonsa]
MQHTYENKKKALFECLNAAERITQGTSLEQREVDYNSIRIPLEPNVNKRRKTEVPGAIEKYKNRDSLFKRPDLPITKCLKSRRTPEYEKNPHGWKHYSLSDVDTSDHANTSAAFSFLREIEDRKYSQERMDEGSSDGKIVFKRSTKLRAITGEVSSDTSGTCKKIQSTKIVMPEYVVGQKIQKEKKPRPSNTKKVDKSKELKLQHLMEEEDDDE